MNFLIAVASIFLVNLLFGYWRSNSRVFSIQWLLAIHIPVALAIGTRLLLLEWNWETTPTFIITFAIGQYAGGKIRSYLVKAPANTAPPEPDLESTSSRPIKSGEYVEEDGQYPA